MNKGELSLFDFIHSSSSQTGKSPKYTSRRHSPTAIRAVSLLGRRRYPFDIDRLRVEDCCFLLQ